MMRTYSVNGVEMYKCHDCGKLFPFDRRKRIAVCEPCRQPPPPPPTRIDVDGNLARFREMNTDYIESLHESVRERRSMAMQTRRSREAAVVSEFTIDEWRSCKKAFDNTCAYCGEKKPLAQDHFIPVSKGGNYTADNIIPACQSCNSSKHDNDFEWWYRRHHAYSPEREAKIIEYLTQASSR